MVLAMKNSTPLKHLTHSSQTLSKARRDVLDEGAQHAKEQDTSILVKTILYIRDRLGCVWVSGRELASCTQDLGLSPRSTKKKKRTPNLN